MKKLMLLIIGIILVFLGFIFITFKPKNYTYQYKVNNVTITESYKKNEGIYYFIFESAKNSYIYSVSNKYSRKRGLIKDISINDNCLKATSKIILDFSFCKQGDDYYSTYYEDVHITTESDSYANITIYDLLGNKYFIWNYTDFISIDSKKVDEINLFTKDIYELNLVTKLKRYLVIADYDEKYAFTKVYLLDSKNNSKKEIILDRKIYLNSYILGTYKNNIYLYDSESKTEYRINPFKNSVNKNAYEVYVDKKWMKVSANKLDKMNLRFSDTKIFGFVLENNELYYKTANNLIKITNMFVSRIIQSSEIECYFISEDALYYVNFYNGITKVMSYSEWKFNNKNIYIF